MRLKLLKLLLVFSFSYFCSATAEEGTVIFLAGTSSAGKTSIANALSEQLEEPYLKVGFDWYAPLLNPRFIGEGKNADQGYQFLISNDHQGQIITVIRQFLAMKLDDAAHTAMTVFLDKGFNLIVDEVLLDDLVLEDYLHKFKKYKVYFFAIKPPLEVAEAREIARGDRMIGFARGFYQTAYKDRKFDLLIDSSTGSPEELAKQILSYMKSTPHPQAFQQNRNQHQNKHELADSSCL